MHSFGKVAGTIIIKKNSSPKYMGRLFPNFIQSIYLVLYK